VVLASSTGIVMLRLAGVRRNFTDDNAWLLDDVDEHNPDNPGDGELAWYLDMLAAFDGYAGEALGGPIVWDTDPAKLRVLMATHPRHRDPAPCQQRLADLWDCRCPEHRSVPSNDLGSVVADLLTRRRTLREFEQLDAELMFDEYDRTQQAGIGAWLRETLDLTGAELALVEELASDGLSARQAVRALSLTRDRDAAG
jgi:hypothetical protein